MGASLPTLKLSYFDIEGLAEKVRLALFMQGIPFEDERISFADWGQKKSEAKYGLLPLLHVDGKEIISQSGAMLRYVARLKSSTLYPENDVKLLEIEEVLGLADDFAKAWSPCLYLGMRPQMFGYPEDHAKTDEGQALIKSMREKFVAERMPEYMKYFTDLLANSEYFCGSQPTIADLTLLPQLRAFQKGHIDHVPVTCLDEYPVVTAWIKRMMELEPIKQWYANGGKVPPKTPTPAPDEDIPAAATEEAK